MTATSPHLIGELSTRSESFRVRWAAHDVRQYRTGTQPFHHLLVGALTLDYEALGLTADIGLTLVVYTAEPGSPSQAALNRLASRGSPPPGVTTLGTNREDDDIVHQPRRR